MTLEGHGQSFKMFRLNKFHHSTKKKKRKEKKEQPPGRFSAMVHIYQSQLGKSSPPKGKQPHYHICMSLRLDWAL